MAVQPLPEKSQKSLQFRTKNLGCGVTTAPSHAGFPKRQTPPRCIRVQKKMLAVDALGCIHSQYFQEMHLNGRTAMTFYDPRGQKTQKIPSVTALQLNSGSNLWAGVPQKFRSKPKPNATRGQIREGVKNKNTGGVG